MPVSDLSIIFGDHWQQLPESSVITATGTKPADLKVFRRSEGSSSSHHDLADKIVLVLQQMASDCFFCDLLIQFWVPTVVGCRLHLTTSDQPFALTPDRPYGDTCGYRKHCMGYDYLVEEEELMGPVGRVYRRGHPESSPDLRLYTTKEHPLRDVAERCGFEKYAAFPVFDTSRNECLGVLESLGWSATEKEDFKNFLEALAAVGFTTTHGGSSLKDDGLNEEFLELLELAIDAVPELHLAQVWFPCELCGNTRNHYICMERAAFLTVYKKPESLIYVDNQFLEACRFLSFQGNIGITALTMLPTNSSFFCRSMGDLGISVYPLAHYAQAARLSFCFAVCVLNREDGNNPCVLEFFLHLDSRQEENPFPILKLILQVIENKLKGYWCFSGRRIAAEVPIEVRAKNNRLETTQCAQNVGPQNSEKLSMMNKMVGWDDLIPFSDIGKYLEEKLFISEWNGEQWENKDWEDEEETWTGGELIFSRSEVECLLYPSNGSSSVSSFDQIQHKITILLCKLFPVFSLLRGYLIQFWAVEQNDERPYLVTVNYPFALNHSYEGLLEYRKHSVNHRYSVNEGAKVEELGPPGRVLRNRYPESTLNLCLYSIEEFPLRDYAVHCGLRVYLAFPVLLNQSECVGVLELISFDASIDSYEASYVLPSIERSFKEANLISTHINFERLDFDFDDQRWKLEVQRLPEVGQLMHLVEGIPHLVDGHVWAPCNQCNDENCMHQKFSYEFSLKHCSGRKWLENRFQRVILGKGIIGTLLATESKLCFFPNICDFNITEETRTHWARVLRMSACFAICLQSSYTGNKPYVFEFFLDQSCQKRENLCMFLSHLFPIMKEQLTSYKVASGRDLGEELVVEVIMNDTTSEFGPFEQRGPNMLPVSFKTFQYTEKIDGQQRKHLAACDRCEFSSTNLDQGVAIHSKKRGRQSIAGGINSHLQDLEPHIGKTLDTVGKELGGNRSTIKRVCMGNGVLRWPSHPENNRNVSLFQTPNSNDRLQGSGCQDLHDNCIDDVTPTDDPLHQHISENNTRGCAQNVAKLIEDDVFIIKAKFKNKMAKIELNVSSKMEKLGKEVAKRFNIEIGSFELKYLDEDNDWILLVCDDDLHLCTKNLQASGKSLVHISVDSIRS